jgi:hypothetical protein
MSIGGRLNSRLTELAVGRHLPYRTARVRLTLLYGALFLVSGAALLAVTYALFVNATGFVFTGQNGWTTELVNGRPHGFYRSIRGPAVAYLHKPLRLAPLNLAAKQRALAAQGNRQHAHVLRYLALESGIALAGMSVLSLLLGWLMAGRVLQPLETPTWSS